MTTTITLELVRHGALHNQLLSPLTPYVALAGNRPAETVHVPVEHAQMLAKLRRLRPEADGDDVSADARTFRATADLREASQVVTRLFETIRGLSEAVTEAIAQRPPPSLRENATILERSGIIRLKLIVSADELAMLPFELAQGPLALGGSDMLSALRPPPVVITRESRRAAVREFSFEEVGDYRVLVVAADPERRGIPLRSVLLALRRSFPMELVSSEMEGDKAASAFRRHVRVLADATVDQVRREVASKRYSHVLVLAHGRMPETLDGRPTILMHSSANARRVDAVSGERLTAAMNAASSEDGSKHRGPLFASLLVCDSAAGSQAPLFAGGSIAHTLHEGGIPFVVASQFPLTFGGAALLTESLFYRLLRNEHPTAAVAEARQRLFTELGETHDWAALVAYLTLPDDAAVETMVRLHRSEAALASLWHAMSALREKVGLETPAARRRISRFEDALSYAREHFDGLFDEARTGQERDGFWETEEGRHRWSEYQRYAALIANACLLQARIHAGGAPLPFILREGPSETHPDRLKVRRSLQATLHYCRVHRRFGGRNADTMLHTTVAQVLLSEPGASSSRKWWRVADWRLLDDSAEYGCGSDVGFLATLTMHLLFAFDIGGFSEEEEEEIRKRLDSASQEIIRVAQRGVLKSPRRLRYLVKRLRRCRESWWSSESKATEEAEKIEARWRDEGIYEEAL